MFVPYNLRTSPLFITIAAATRFLGGMNLAIYLFSLSVLFAGHLFTETDEKIVLLFFL